MVAMAVPVQPGRTRPTTQISPLFGWVEMGYQDAAGRRLSYARTCSSRNSLAPGRPEQRPRRLLSSWSTRA